MIRQGTRRAAATILVVALLAACSARVPLPPDDAAPRQVLDAYLVALVAGDCETVKALTSNGRQGLCGSVTGYAPPRLILAFGGERIFSTSVTILGGDGTLPEGPNFWNYTLGQDATGRWRIVNEGTG